MHGLINMLVHSKNRKQVTIDIDSTNDATHGHQQLSMYI